MNLAGYYEITISIKFTIDPDDKIFMRSSNLNPFSCSVNKAVAANKMFPPVFTDLWVIFPEASVHLCMYFSVQTTLFASAMSSMFCIYGRLICPKSSKSLITNVNESNASQTSKQCNFLHHIPYT